MSDELRGLLRVMRHGRLGWPSFNRELVWAAFFLPDGTGRAPVIVYSLPLFIAFLGLRVLWELQVSLSLLLGRTGS